MAASNNIPSQHQYSDYSNYNLSPELIFGLREETASHTMMTMKNNNTPAAMETMTTMMINSPVSSVGSFPDQQFGINNNNNNNNPPDSSMAVPALSTSEWDMGIAGCNNNNQAFESGEVCSGLLMASNFAPPPIDINHHMPPDIPYWGTVQGKQVAKVEESEVKVGRYSVEERKDRILRYIKKRNQRNFTKTIKYACRKTLADKRVRIRGRFAKNSNEPCGENGNIMKSTDITFQQNMSSYDNSLQMIDSDDDWLEAAMAGLVYSSYTAS